MGTYKYAIFQQTPRARRTAQKIKY